ncbi:hypothetical protein [Sphingosinicella sp. BN140058]|uniref:hypothetical protein n=1 Tax=Sphingosinicella sp. BN140058 TaxID=1892855 RepID=UPI0010115902|nr:hypothetical protein [Sphingosinicella sp. BN140058]QAY78277.1 hypothetical protein ETR14_18350 [Sphingosinicella sp. BN140058]
MRALLLLAALALSTAAHPASAAALPDRWKTYINVRYGFAICYPSGLFEAQGEADNGDGQVFKARDGAELRAFGTNNVLDRSLAAEFAAQVRSFIGRNGKITYRVTRPGWEVVSGTNGGSRLFYAKTFARNDQFITFQLTYSKAATQRYRPVVDRLAQCFRLTQGHS